MILGPKGGRGFWSWPLKWVGKWRGGNGARGVPRGGAHLESHQGGRAPAQCQQGRWDEGTQSCRDQRGALGNQLGRPWDWALTWFLNYNSSARAPHPHYYSETCSL